jgi:predicted negative regulator of RcsB-dependent stress response
MDHAKQPEFAHIARLRLGKLLLAMGEGAQALALLEPVKADAYGAEYEELKGDIYAETGQPDKARQAYRLALDKLGPGSDSRVLRIKLNSLGVPAG